MIPEPTDYVQPDLRYEVKMVCEERARDAVLASMAIHPAGIRKLYPARQVQSIYFDTVRGRALAENLAGIADRSKLRVRWYGADATEVHAVLERKTRRNKLGSKDLLPLPGRLAVTGVDRHAFRRSVLACCDSIWRERLHEGVEVAQWISYQREYFITADHSVRITVDRDLRAHDLRHRLVIDRSQATPLPKILVIECKAGTAQRESLERLLQHLPLVVDRCSKFVLASSPAHGPTISRLGW